jgi:TM2 domain-containing membrane protein YozV
MPVSRSTEATMEDRYYLQYMGGETGPFTLFDLRQKALRQELSPLAPVRRADEENWRPARDVPDLYSNKEWLVAVLLAVFLGGLGVDRMYVGQIGIGVAKLITCGGLGIWAFVDLILFALNRIPDEQGRPLRQ